MTAPADFPNLPCLPPTPPKEVFLANLNKHLGDGRYVVAAIEDLRAKRFQKASGESSLTEQNLATHVLIEAEVFNNPNLVRYKNYRQDGMASYRKGSDRLDVALYDCANTRETWVRYQPDLLVATKIEVFRHELNHL